MATASPLQSKLFSQILQCPMCLETFKRPKVIPCGHTYCTSCLQSHINTNLTSKETLNARFPCLVCGANTTPFDHTVETGQWAESFPVNRMVASLLDVNMGMKGRKGCDFCMKRRRQNSATSYCQDCHISMCDICKQYHDDISVCSQKSSFTFNENYEPDNVKVRPNLAFIEMCLKHPDERIKFICGDHHVLCCNTCGFLQHRMCDNIITLEDILQTADVQIKSKEVETNLKKCNNHLKQKANCIRMNSDTLQDDNATILKTISSLIEHLNVTIEKLEKDVTVSLKDAHKSEILILKYQENKGNNLMTAIHSDLMQLDLVMTKGSEVQKVITLHNLGQKQHKYFQSTSEYLNSVNVVRLTLDVDRSFLDLLDTVGKFGQIYVTRSKFHFSPCEKETIIQQQESNFEMETKLKYVSQYETKKIIQPKPKNGSAHAEIPLRDRNVVKVTEFNAKSVRDNNMCQISDILQLQDSRLLIVDNKHFKVKILGQDYKCLHCMPFTDCPWNVCFLSGTDVALTVPYKKTIQVIRITDKMETIREIKTDFQCWGIATIRDRLVVTTWTDGHCLLILDFNGTEIRKITPNNPRKDQLSYPSSVTTNRTHTVVYVTYHSGYSLVAYNSNWDIVFTYTDQGQQGPGGVDTDHEGNIYLCDSNSNNIQKISADGKFVSAILSGQRRPLKIRFFKYTDRFFLTYQNCNVVEVYDLK